MSYREVPRMEIPQIIRRWQTGSSLRQIAASTGLSRDTATKYAAVSKAEGIAQDGPRPARTCLSREPTRFMSGSPMTGYR